MGFDTIIPSALSLICSGVLAFIWLDIRGFKAEIMEIIEDIKDEYLKRKEHEMICSNSSLQVKGRIDLLEQGLSGRLERIEGMIARLANYNP